MSAAFDEVRDILQKKQFSRLFVGNTENTLIQFFRYCFVGGLATVVDWGVSLLLFHLVFGGRYAVAANVLSFVCGLIVNYLISTFWIFKTSRMKSKTGEFLGFAAIGAVGALITLGITHLFTLWLAEKTSAYQIIAKVVSTAVAFLWNFFARKILLFSKKEDQL